MNKLFKYTKIISMGLILVLLLTGCRSTTLEKSSKTEEEISKNTGLTYIKTTYDLIYSPEALEKDLNGLNFKRGNFIEGKQSTYYRKIDNTPYVEMISWYGDKSTQEEQIFYTIEDATIIEEPQTLDLTEPNINSKETDDPAVSAVLNQKISDSNLDLINESFLVFQKSEVENNNSDQSQLLLINGQNINEQGTIYYSEIMEISENIPFILNNTYVLSAEELTGKRNKFITYYSDFITELTTLNTNKVSKDKKSKDGEVIEVKKDDKTIVIDNTQENKDSTGTTTK